MVDYEGEDCKTCKHDTSGEMCINENGFNCSKCECYNNPNDPGPYVCYCVNYRLGHTYDEKCRYRKEILK